MGKNKPRSYKNSMKLDVLYGTQPNCPNCGSKQCQETLMGTILNLEHSQKYEDSNIYICSDCDMKCVIDPSKEWSQQRIVQSIGQQVAKEVDQELVEYFSNINDSMLKPRPACKDACFKQINRSK